MVVSSGKVYGSGYCEFYTTLNDLKNDLSSNTILRMFSSKGFIPSEEELNNFTKEYENQLNYGNHKNKDVIIESFKQSKEEIKNKNCKKQTKP
jgi:ribosomal protein S8